MACQFTFEEIGTAWTIDINEEISALAQQSLLTKIRLRISDFDKTYSRFRADSLVTAMSKKAGTYILPDDAEALFSTYILFYALTGGLFTPLIGETLVDAGYDAQYSLLQKKPLTQPPRWEEAIEYSYPEMNIKKPVLIDVGAAGKGYLIDIVSEVIEKEGIKSYCVDAGGDIRQRSNNAEEFLNIGLEDPDDTSKVIGVAKLSHKSLCGSAGNRRKWQHFHHIINPQTLVSPTEIAAVWVIADTTIVADALSTSLFFTQPAIFLSAFSFEYLIMNADRSIKASPLFPAELFIQ